MKNQVNKITFRQFIASKFLRNKFTNQTPIVAVKQHGVSKPILVDDLPLLTTHTICYDLIKDRFIKKFFTNVDKNIVVIYI